MAIIESARVEFARKAKPVAPSAILGEKKMKEAPIPIVMQE